MKKTIFYIFSFVVISLVIFSPSVFAEQWQEIGPTPGGTQNGGNNANVIIDDKEDIITIAENIATWIYRIFFVVAVIYILFAAFQYLTAKDDAATVKKAQASLKNAVIAIIVALVSTGFALLVKEFIKP